MLGDGCFGKCSGLLFGEPIRSENVHEEILRELAQFKVPAKETKSEIKQQLKQQESIEMRMNILYQRFQDF